MRATFAVILARGLGTRLQQDDGTALDAAQAQAATAGRKPLVPVLGRPLLDYALSALADAGVMDVVLVIAPGESPLRDRYERDEPPARLRVRFAVQDEPRGTAHALLAARGAVCASLGAPVDEAGHRHFLMCNADNLYSVAAIRALVELTGPGLIAYEADALVRESGLDAARVARFALLQLAGDGALADLVEKPESGHPLLLAPKRWVSMNLWRFRDTIFDECAAVQPSPRGELELVDAVRRALRRGERFTAIPRAEAVLDLTHRRDLAALEARLAGVVPRP
jgi:glucose-1-phosphate thymidylyltransferase